MRGGRFFCARIGVYKLLQWGVVACQGPCVLQPRVVLMQLQQTPAVRVHVHTCSHP